MSGAEMASSGGAHAHRALPIGAAGAVVTVGTFDGVHRGHLHLLRHLVERAGHRGCPALVVTFEPHPLAVLRPDVAPPRLTTPAEQLEQLVQVGVQYVAVLPFTPVLAALEPAAFVDRVLVQRYGVVELLVGHDHGFGRGRAGDAETLRAIGAARGIAVRVQAAVPGPDGAPVSSTRIRTALRAGHVEEAAALLGRPYAVAGVVVGGDGRGRHLGYPTLNVTLPAPDKLLPADGVYAVRVQTRGGAHRGMVHLGGRPTFGDGDRRLEAHLFDVNGDWYGAPVRVDFVARLRGVQTFPDPEALRRQLTADAVAARAALAAGPA